MKDKVAGLASVQSPYGGSPIASDILREGQIADKDTRGIKEFLISNARNLYRSINFRNRFISFNSEASMGPDVIATMFHMAHSEDIVVGGCKIPVLVPFSVVLAVCALHLQLRYGEKSNGMVTCRDAEVPGSVVVRPEGKLDHVWMVYSSWKKVSLTPMKLAKCARHS
ncbi:hypothetical protein RJ641_026856 [Dillenia turbinata]|uniref:Uncharacterized protein n=1 Tax=Dillenia turbinata TaxID=194707 RepID=A0AAN8W199_9MAGN